MIEWTAGEFRFPIVEIPSSATMTPEAAIQFLVQHLVELGQIKTEHAALVERAVLGRESLGSTGIGGGSAIPHSISGLVETVIGVLGRISSGMLWPNSVDHQPVRQVCLLVSPAEKPRDAMLALQAVKAQLEMD